MSAKTPFAGLDVLGPGEPFSTDGYQFQSVDRLTIDRLLKLGAVTHRHDAHAALANPTVQPTLSVESGGLIPSGVTIYVTYTLLDQDNGESLPVAAKTITTGGGFATPVLAPAAVVDYTAGSLLADNYSYGVTVTDGIGGETPISPAAQVTIFTGHVHAEVTISGLAAILAASSSGGSGAAWRLWRMGGGGIWYLIDTGTADTSTDIGIPGDCTVVPPTASTVGGSNSLSVTVPTGQPSGTISFNIYAALGGSFLSPALLATLPASQLGVAQVYTDLLLTIGAPPSISTCLPGANAITSADLALNWLSPVATQADLPTTGNTDGDARVALDGPTINVWQDSASAWTAVGGGGGGGGASSWKAPVADYSHWPTGSTTGDVVINLDPFTGPAIGLWDGSEWVALNLLKPAVADIASLPATGNDGNEIRVAYGSDGPTLNLWSGASWQVLGGYRHTVANIAALPTTGNTTGDLRVALDGPTLNLWTGSAWTTLAGAGGGGSSGGWQGAFSSSTTYHAGDIVRFTTGDDGIYLALADTPGALPVLPPWPASQLSAYQLNGSATYAPATGITLAAAANQYSTAFFPTVAHLDGLEITVVMESTISDPTGDGASFGPIFLPGGVPTTIGGAGFGNGMGIYSSGAAFMAIRFGEPLSSGPGIAGVVEIFENSGSNLAVNTSTVGVYTWVFTVKYISGAYQITGTRSDGATFTVSADGSEPAPGAANWLVGFGGAMGDTASGHLRIRSVGVVQQGGNWRRLDNLS